MLGGVRVTAASARDTVLTQLRGKDRHRYARDAVGHRSVSKVRTGCSGREELLSAEGSKTCGSGGMGPGMA